MRRDDGGVPAVAREQEHRDEGGEEEQLVGERIEQRPEPGDEVPAAGELAVPVVGDGDDDEERERGEPERPRGRERQQRHERRDDDTTDRERVREIQ